MQELVQMMLPQEQVLVKTAVLGAGNDIYTAKWWS